MGKRTKSFYGMMDNYQKAMQKLAQPSEWDVMAGDMLKADLARTPGDIMAQNLGPFSQWKRMYEANQRPQAGLGGAGMRLANTMATNLGAQELARDYGLQGEKTVSAHKDMTRNFLQGQQTYNQNKLASVVQGYLSGAQTYNAFQPPKRKFDAIMDGIGKTLTLGMAPSK